MGILLHCVFDYPLYGGDEPGDRQDEEEMQMILHDSSEVSLLCSRGNDKARGGHHLAVTLHDSPNVFSSGQNEQWRRSFVCSSCCSTPGSGHFPSKRDVYCNVSES